MKRVQTISDMILKEVERIIIGKSNEIRLLILGLLSNGHILIDDIPGVGKTTLAKTIAIVIGCDFKRIQFVSDLMPGDILGMNVFNQKTGEFQLKQGAIHTNILLADEINRATARTQSALLEAMEEKQTTIDSISYPLPSPFIVIATQNPIERENTFKLPVAQLDRFMISISLGYPEKEDEIKMLRSTGDNIRYSVLETVTEANEIMEMQELINSVYVSEEVLEYIVDITEETRNMSEISVGASPRATKSLYKAAKTFAAMEGRDFVTPDDVQYVAVPVLNHRIILSTPSRISKEKNSNIIMDILNKVEIKTR